MKDDSQEDVRRWINDLLDGDISPEDSQRLESQLRDDRQTRAMYSNSMELHANLEWRLGRAFSTPQFQDSSQNASPFATNGFHELVDSANAVAHAEKTTNDKAVRRRFHVSRFSVAVSVAIVLTAVAVVSAAKVIVDILLQSRAVVASQSGGVLRFRDSESQSDVAPGSNLNRGTRRIGSSSLPGVALANVLVFSLPHLAASEQIESARLEWTYKAKDGHPQFNVDLYGLGFVHARAVLGKGFFEGREDSSLRSAYGMEGSRQRRVALIKEAAITPKTPLGRVAVDNRTITAFLQSLYDDGAKEGDLVVFRLNADMEMARDRSATGYAVVHPPARPGHSEPAELPVLRISTKRPMPADTYLVADAVVSTQAISAHWGGGVAASNGSEITSGWSTNGTRRIGSAFAPNVALANVIVFPLPPLEDFEHVQFVQLEWTCLSTRSKPKFSVDLYGLGYTHSDWYRGPCFWEGKLDTSLRAEYGLLGAPERRVALIQRGAMKPDISPGRVVVENKQLLDFLRSLYADGAQAGDLVVFRLNADTPTSQIPRPTGYEVVHAPVTALSTSHSDLPMLRMSGR